MNYRLLLSEMLIDYYERREKTKCGKTFKVYTEIIGDLQLALEIEPNQIAIVNEANKLLNSTECNITPVVASVFLPLSPTKKKDLKILIIVSKRFVYLNHQRSEHDTSSNNQTRNSQRRKFSKIYSRC